MKKTSPHRKPIPPEDALERYDWDKAVRGRHAHRFPKGALAVVIAPELRRHFATADAVNDGLRVLLKMATLAKTGSPPKARTGKRREVAYAAPPFSLLDGANQIEPPLLPYSAALV